MIPARPGHWAQFTNHPYLPIEAWDDDGHALVAGENGRLVKATAIGGFERLYEQPEAIGVVPADGTHGIVAWVVRSDMSMVPRSGTMGLKLGGPERPDNVRQLPGT